MHSCAWSSLRKVDSFIFLLFFSPNKKIPSDSGCINIYRTLSGVFSSPGLCFLVSVAFKVWDNTSNCKDLNFKLRSHDSFTSGRLIDFMFLLLSCHRRRTSIIWESLFPSNVKINSPSGFILLHHLDTCLKCVLSETNKIRIFSFFFCISELLCVKS